MKTNNFPSFARIFPIRTASVNLTGQTIQTRGLILSCIGTATNVVVTIVALNGDTGQSVTVKFKCDTQNPCPLIPWAVSEITSITLSTGSFGTDVEVYGVM
jgi:hypothetical protein